MSRLASATSRPMVGSSGVTGATVFEGAIGALVVITSPFAAIQPRTVVVPLRLED
jgi:hypothetical protein